MISLLIILIVCLLLTNTLMGFWVYLILRETNGLLAEMNEYLKQIRDKCQNLS